MAFVEPVIIRTKPKRVFSGQLGLRETNHPSGHVFGSLSVCQAAGEDVRCITWPADAFVYLKNIPAVTLVRGKRRNPFPPRGGARRATEQSFERVLVCICIATYIHT